MILPKYHRVLLSRAQCYLQARITSRCFSNSTYLLSGHSRWAKIKHDKGKADNVKNKERSFIAHELVNASKRTSSVASLDHLLKTIIDGGPDPTSNFRLSPLIAQAKKIGFPKTSIDAAIARGQGFSPSGNALEEMTIDFMLPAINVAGIVECLTDSKARTMQIVRDVFKQCGAQSTPTAYMFDRKGKIVVTNAEGNVWDEEDLLDKAIESGAEDISIEDEDAIIYTNPSQMAAVAEALSVTLHMKPASQDLIWVAKEDMNVELANTEDQQVLQKLMDKLEDEPTIQEIYLNAA